MYVQVILSLIRPPVAVCVLKEHDCGCQFLSHLLVSLCCMCQFLSDCVYIFSVKT